MAPRYGATRRWLDGVPAEELFTSAVCIGEFAAGVAGLSEGELRRAQEFHLHNRLLPAFPVLGFDVSTALRWGAYMGEGRRAGVKPPTDDAKIAATAMTHGLTVATHNGHD